MASDMPQGSTTHFRISSKYFTRLNFKWTNNADCSAISFTVINKERSAKYSTIDIVATNLQKKNNETQSTRPAIAEIKFQ